MIDGQPTPMVAVEDQAAEVAAGENKPLILVNIDDEMRIAFANYDKYPALEQLQLFTVIENERIPFNALSVETKNKVFEALVVHGSGAVSGDIKRLKVAVRKMFCGFTFSRDRIISKPKSYNLSVDEAVFQMFKDEQYRNDSYYHNQVAAFSKQLTNQFFGELLADAAHTQYFGTIIEFSKGNEFVDTRRIMVAATKVKNKYVLENVLTAFPETKRFVSMI